MKSLNKKIGSTGEDIAAQYLNKIGCTIIERNFNCRIGEIDIIVKDGNYIVFVEVKTRYDVRHGMPREAVTTYKQHKIYKTAQYYIMMKKLFKLNFRFDVVEIIIDKENNNTSINLIKNAFQI